MKLLAKDLSNGQTTVTTTVDVLTSGKLSTADVFSGIGVDIATQSSRPTNVAKGLWLNNSSELRFYNGSADHNVAHSGTSLGGDLSGTLSSGTVAKLQNRTVASTAPSDGQMLAWNNSLSQWEPQTPAGGATTLPQLTDVYSSLTPSDEHVFYYDGGNTRWDSKYPGVVNFPGTRTFTILDSTASASDINTALTNYDVVYLKSGSYSLGSTAITIPQGKSLLGLGISGTSNAVNFQWTGSPTSRHILMDDGRLENVYIYLLGVAHTTNVIEGSSTYTGKNIVHDVIVIPQASASIWAFYGVFSEISRISCGRDDSLGYGVDGINLTGRPAYRYSSNGPVVISNFYIGSAPTYGIYLGAGFSDLVIKDGYIDGYNGVTDFGLYCAISSGLMNNIKVNNVRVTGPGNTGFYIQGTASFKVDFHFNGCRVDGASGTTQYGFFGNYADHSTWEDCSAQSCNGSTTIGRGSLAVYNSAFINVSGCEGSLASNTNNSDFYFSNVDNSTFANLRSYGSQYGAYWTSGTNTGNTVTGVTIVSSSTVASSFYYSGSYSSLSGIETYDCYGNIFILGTNVAASSISSYSSGTSGVSLQISDSAASAISAYDAATFGVITAGSRSSFSVLTSYSAGSYGLYLGADYSSYSSLTSMLGASHGVYAICQYSSIRSGSIVSNTGRGIEITAAGIDVSGLVIYNNGNNGVYMNAAFCSLDHCQIMSNLTSSTGYGLYVTTACTRCRISDNLIYGHNGTSDAGVYFANVASTSAYHNNNESNNNAGSYGSGWNVNYNFAGS